MNLDELKKEAEVDFEDAWQSGNVSGWGSEIKELNQQLTALNTEQHAEVPDKFFCNVCRFFSIFAQLTFTHRSGKKDFSKSTVFEAHLKSKKHAAKQAAAALEEEEEEQHQQHEEVEVLKNRLEESLKKKRDLAFQEALIKKYGEVLEATREETRAFVERRQTLTDRERDVLFP